VEGVKQLIGYPNISPISTIHPPHPDFSPDSQAQDAVWVGGTIFVSFLKGGGWWWYGKPDPWTDPNAHRSRCKFNAGNPQWGDGSGSCATEWLERGLELPVGTFDNCDSGKGYHALLDPDGSGGNQRSIQLQFYNAAEVADVASGVKNPSDVLPYAYMTDPGEFWTSGCPSVGGIAYDGKRLYWVEKNAVNPLIHVDSLGKGES
jgi:hypothetical protein